MSIKKTILNNLFNISGNVSRPTHDIDSLEAMLLKSQKGVHSLLSSIAKQSMCPSVQ